MSAPLRADGNVLMFLTLSFLLVSAYFLWFGITEAKRHAKGVVGDSDGDSDGNSDDAPLGMKIHNPMAVDIDSEKQKSLG